MTDPRALNHIPYPHETAGSPTAIPGVGRRIYPDGMMELVIGGPEARGLTLPMGLLLRYLVSEPALDGFPVVVQTAPTPQSGCKIGDTYCFDDRAIQAPDALRRMTSAALYGQITIGEPWLTPPDGNRTPTPVAAIALPYLHHGYFQREVGTAIQQGEHSPVNYGMTRLARAPENWSSIFS